MIAMMMVLVVGVVMNIFLVLIFVISFGIDDGDLNIVDHTLDRIVE
jgi:hypothetical protein